MTPTEQAISALPPHLRRFAVEQHYDAYTPRDHAVWRYVLRRLVEGLAGRAHPKWFAGLGATGIGTESIPDLDDMNVALARCGWSTVPVRGFIPPAVFTELQSRRVLAIAADVRTHEHVEYTPAPDIVHESAGHAPLVSEPTYAEYLRRCGEAGFRAIASAEDQAVFEAIRNLSVVKEDPAATPEEVELAEAQLEAAAASQREPSEATRASRLYWWTAEYGLVGPLASPWIYGAGLLSSFGEAAHCLGPEVERIPLDAACAEAPYDITRMQPRLFVARDFEHLFEVLEEVSATMSFARGGEHGIDAAIRARTVNHLVLAGGREVTGRVSARIPTGGPAALVRLEGPILRSRGGVGEGGPFPGEGLVALGEGALPERGPFDVAFASGLRLRGFAVGGGEVLRLEATLAGAPLDVPPWAVLAVARSVPSVRGGPADPGTWDGWFGALSTFAAGEGEARARAHKATALPPPLAALYAEVRAFRGSGAAARDRLLAIRAAARAFEDDWLLAREVEELLGAERPDERAGAAAS